MGKKKRIFLSFSSRDMKYVNDFMATLKHQGLEVWDYSNEIESIEASIANRKHPEIETEDTA